MAKINPSSGGGEFDSGVVNVNAATNVLVLDLEIPPAAGVGPYRGFVSLFGFVGAGGALAQFKVCAVDPVTGAEVPLRADAAFNTADNLCPFATNNVHQTAANGAFVVLLQRLPAVNRIKVYAGKAAANTTLRLTGIVR
jgi:hypothetical protein